MLITVKNTFASLTRNLTSRPSRRRARRRQQPVSAAVSMENLEARELLTASFAVNAYLSGDTLVVHGGGDAVNVHVVQAGSQIEVRENDASAAATYSFASDGVKSIRFSGTAENDRFQNHTNLASELFGFAGNDTLIGGFGNDTIRGGIGADSIMGGLGHDSIYGGADNDNLFGGTDNDDTSVFTEAFHDGNDWIYGEAGDDVINGGWGNDWLEGGSENDTIHGHNGGDLLNGGAGNDELVGGAGNDWIEGWDGNDVLEGGVGDDSLQGGNDEDWLFGEAGNDSLYGQDGDDVLVGGQDFDQIDMGYGDENIVVLNNNDYYDYVVGLGDLAFVYVTDFTEPAAVAADLLDYMDLDAPSLAQILNDMPVQAVADVLNEMPTQTVVDVLTALSGPAVADVLTQMGDVAAFDFVKDNSDLFNRTFQYASNNSFLANLTIRLDAHAQGLTPDEALSHINLSKQLYVNFFNALGSDRNGNVLFEYTNDAVGLTFSHIGDSLATSITTNLTHANVAGFLQHALSTVDAQRFSNIMNEMTETFRVALLGNATRAQLQDIVATATGAVTSTAQTILNGLSSDDDGGSVICTELRRQGLMEDAVWEADERYGEMIRATDPKVYAGYYHWAQHVARWMKNSPALTRIVQVFAKPWAEEMAYQMGAQETGNWRGKAIMAIGTPVCRWIGASLQTDAELCSNAS